MDKQKDFCTTKCRSLFYFQAAARACARGMFYLTVKWLALRAGAPVRGAGFLFRSNGLRSARARGRAGFFFELVLALVARGMFYLTVKWLALRAGQSALSLRLIVLF